MNRNEILEGAELGGKTAGNGAEKRRQLLHCPPSKWCAEQFCVPIKLPPMAGRPVELLLVEDSPSDAELTLEAMRDGKIRNNLSIVEDGVEAMGFLRRQGQYASAPRPDLILLDLNLRLKDGREVLAEIKADNDLASIPVVVLTTSAAEQDLLRAQDLQAHSYLTLPVQFAQFWNVVRTIGSFSIFVVALPPVLLPSGISSSSARA